MHVVRSSPEAVDEEASAAAGSGTVKNEDEEEKEEEESKTDSEESPAPAPTDQEKRELQEGYNRCYAKRIFKLFADHRPTVPLDEVVETVEQCQHDLCGFYKSLCHAHGLVVGRPVWEPPDDNLDFLPACLSRDREGQPVDMAFRAQRQSPPPREPAKAAAKPKVVITPAKVKYQPEPKPAGPKPPGPKPPPPPPTPPPTPHKQGS